MQATMIIVAIVGIACGGNKSDDAAASRGPKTYKLSTRADKEDPPGGVTVTISWPAGWKEKSAKSSFGITSVGPTVMMPGATGDEEVTVLMLRPCPEGFEGASCVDHVIQTLLRGPERTNVGDRVWAKSTMGDMVFGALFAYHVASKTVVVCQALVTPANEPKLADARKACEGLAL